MTRPRIAITMGDVAGVGPEIVARTCCDPGVREICDPIVIGNPAVLTRALELVGSYHEILEAESFAERTGAISGAIPCFNRVADNAENVAVGQVDAAAGRAAYEYLIAAIDAAKSGSVDAIVTAPINKAALKLAGHDYPGHTEILAEECDVSKYAMMLHLSADTMCGIRSTNGAASDIRRGLSIVHVTLHTALQHVPSTLTTTAVREKIELMHEFLASLDEDRARIGVCALNPHAGEEGLFGDEEERLIRPAVEAALNAGADVAGPFPTDTLMRRAVLGEFDGLVAMYHDQGHIAVKLFAFHSAVNVTLGLPIIRTSPTHGTAFDIAWQGTADAGGMTQAIRTATRLARHRSTIE